MSQNINTSPIKLLQSMVNTSKVTLQKKIQKVLGLDDMQKQITYLCKNTATKNDVIKEMNKVVTTPEHIHDDASCSSTKNIQKDKSHTS